MKLHGHRQTALLACVRMSVQRKVISSSDLNNMIVLYAGVLTSSACQPWKVLYVKKTKHVRDSVAPRGSEKT